jgi:hypothetical protein|uniref:Uncharacterized protein n=1 Tax=Zea mays TaxID=4577 RepID=C0HH82_MAIZE|nr:unknown [Zea mays]
MFHPTHILSQYPNNTEQLVTAGFGADRSSALLSGHEELHPEAAGRQEEGPQGEDELGLLR